ncbi:hypothetical protein Y88_0821 [Novosphingobium nitrogenifigens DSM 19370]|uniref:Uncharacterized protein n=1 Tax=Novosphingobium nitrogenifigens DSM 19370 TaxID=983920 RepID=F1Z9H8_9SPHN|nr:hypothetical protein Y88_0821 [Novosphingobium nitrogenifigens DSM 19370]
MLEQADHRDGCPSQTPSGTKSPFQSKAIAPIISRRRKASVNLTVTPRERVVKSDGNRRTLRQSP